MCQRNQTLVNYFLIVDITTKISWNENTICMVKPTQRHTPYLNLNFNDGSNLTLTKSKSGFNVSFSTADGQYIRFLPTGGILIQKMATPHNKHHDSFCENSRLYLPTVRLYFYLGCFSKASRRRASSYTIS